MRSVFPYPTLAGEVGFEITGASLDGRAQPIHMISRQERVVAFHETERPNWHEGRLDLRASLPEREIASGTWSEVACVAVATEGITNARTVARLSKGADGNWGGSLTLARDLYRRRAEVQLIVVATVDSTPGRMIAAAEMSWIVDFEARTPIRQRDLRINEIHFRDGELEWLRPFKDSPWLIETATGDTPTVHLNLGFEGLKELLDGGASTAEKVLRGTVAAQIAAEAWSAMFHSAVSDLEVDDDGSPQWPDGWRGVVLRVMLPDIYPDLPPADALFEANSCRVEGSGWHELQSRIQYAASRRARVSRHLGAAIRLADRAEGTRV
ncbi:hypothetical protein [Streptomyces sp. NBC_01615]|uniref:hypothetical protein n=1 Tax=Streptomyces sp. NBC_01615 TaxID=2975898 RepID=UPI0038685F86